MKRECKHGTSSEFECMECWLDRRKIKIKYKAFLGVFIPTAILVIMFVWVYVGYRHLI